MFSVMLCVHTCVYLCLSACLPNVFEPVIHHIVLVYLLLEGLAVDTINLTYHAQAFCILVGCMYVQVSILVRQLVLVQVCGWPWLRVGMCIGMCMYACVLESVGNIILSMYHIHYYT